MKPAGTTAIITGAGRGIGRAIAIALANKGLHVGLLARSEDQLKAVADEIRAGGGTACYTVCDLAELDRVPHAFNKLQEQLGQVDILVNNAGLFVERSVEQLDCSEWERVMRVNLTAPFLLSQLALPHMKKAGGGRIINIASTASMQGYLHQSAYCASKHGLLGFARALAIEAKKENIHVHTLCPGGVDTDMIQGTQLAERMEGQPMILSEDMAKMVLFILEQPGNIDLPEIVVRRFIPE